MAHGDEAHGGQEHEGAAADAAVRHAPEGDRLRSLRWKLHGIYSFFDKLLVTEYYYRMALVPTRRAGEAWKLGAAVLSAAGASAVLGDLDRAWALLAVLGAGAPYLKNLMGFSEKRVSHLEGLWRGTRALREMMHRDVIERISADRVEIEASAEVPQRLLDTLDAIRESEAELARDAPALTRNDDDLRRRATLEARRVFPPKNWWYP